jgi:cobalt-zinc-cadmium efflux system outer membrane protein
LQVGLWPNPLVGYLGEDMGDAGGAGLQGGFVGQRIVTSGKLSLNRTVVMHEITRAEQQWEIQRRRVVNDVRVAAYEVLAAQRTVTLAERLVDVGDQGKKTAEALLEAAQVGVADVLQARIEANSARLRRLSARNGLQAKWRELASFVGIPDLELSPVTDTLDEDFPRLDWEQSVNRLMASSPELARAYANVEQRLAALERQWAGRIPDVELMLGARYNNASEDTVATVELGTPLPVFDRNQGNIRRAQAELASARQDVRRVELDLEKRLAATFARYLDAQQQVQRYRTDILPDARRTLELVRHGYSEGEFSYLELLTAQRTYFRVNMEYVDTLRGLWVSITRIEGMLLTGGLAAPGP